MAPVKKTVEFEQFSDSNADKSRGFMEIEGSGNVSVGPENGHAIITVYTATSTVIHSLHLRLVFEIIKNLSTIERFFIATKSLTIVEFWHYTASSCFTSATLGKTLIR
jgi:hypothetical protein